MEKFMRSPVCLLWNIPFLCLYSHLSLADLSNNLVLNPTELDIVFSYDGTKSQNGIESNESEWEAGLRIGQSGYLLDPKIAWFLIDLEPVVRRGEFNSDVSDQDTDGKLMNYLVLTNFLRGTPGPFGFDLSAQRSDNINSGSLGNRFDTLIDSNKAVLHWKNPAFPMSLSYEERTLDEEFRSSLDSPVTERNEILKNWIVKGRSSKLNIHLQHTDSDDRIVSRDNDYELDRAVLNHNFKWGKNSQLTSNINHYERTGFSANKRLTANENVRIQHFENLYSRASIYYQSTEQAIENREKGFDYELHHRLYNNLNSTAFVNSSKQDSDNVNEDKWRVGLGTTYNKNNLFGAKVNAGARLSYQRTDRDSMSGLIDVIDESHIVPLSGAILLSRRFIVTSSIVVTDSTGSVIYIEGTDYTTFSVDGDFTQLQIVPGGRISTGDNIFVSYSAEQLPTQEFSTIFSNINFNIDYDWVRLSHSDSRSNDKLISGSSESFLNDSQHTLSEIEFHFAPSNIDTKLGIERRYTLNGDFDSTQHTLSQLFSWKTLKSKKHQGILWNLNSTQSFTKQNQLDTDLYRLELSANWRPNPRLRVRPVLSIWRRIDSGDAVTGNKREDEFFTIGLWARWRYRKVDFDFNYDHNQRTVTRPEINDKTELTEDRIMFTLKRRIL